MLQSSASKEDRFLVVSIKDGIVHKENYHDLKLSSTHQDSGLRRKKTESTQASRSQFN